MNAAGELMNIVSTRFANLLQSRFSKNVFTTEDSIRYTFFAALLEQGIRPEEIVLEYPHPAIPRARLDVLVSSTEQRREIGIEFKYDRRTLSGTNQPMPQKAGAVFKDFIRLLQWPEPLERYLVYLTDDELHRYLTSPRNGLSTIFGLTPGKNLDVDRSSFLERSPTFLGSMGNWLVPATLTCVATEILPRDHFLRVFEVQPLVRN